MRLFVGLGNPGDKYARHRHNIGFMAAERIHDIHRFGPWRDKFQGLVADGVLAGPGGREKVLLLKPLTYMNESGQSVGAAMRFYKLEPEDVTVFYDELDLAAAKVRVKRGGGAAGHNGIRSIASHIGPEFERVRIGIGHPGDKNRVTNHVLGDFSKAERSDWVEELLDAMADAAPHLAVGAADRFQTAVAHALAPPPSSRRAESDAKNANDSAKPANAPHTDKSGDGSEKSRGALADGLAKLFGKKEN